MEDYLRLISEKHHKKLQQIADKKGLTIDEAMGNLVQYVKNNLKSVPEYMEEPITIKESEDTIDLVCLGLGI